MIDRRELEDKLTKELLKIVYYNLQTTIHLSLFLKDVKVEQSFNSSGALNNIGLSEISRNITLFFKQTREGIWWEQHYWAKINYHHRSPTIFSTNLWNKEVTTVGELSSGWPKGGRGCLIEVAT